MSSLPPLDVNVYARRPSCILDVELALSRCGLLLATRLAEEFNVWLVRALWEILDNTDFYAEPRRGLIATASSAPSAAATVPLWRCAMRPDVIRQWEAARLGTDIAGLQLFWAGDARHDSFLPKDIDKDLVNHLDLLSAELDALSLRSEGEACCYDPVRDGFRDAVALAAALVRHRPIIFSMSADGETSGPNLCAYLRDCGIGCRNIEDRRLVEPIRRNLLPMLARTGVLELTWTGLRFAAVHLIAPNATVMPAERDMDRRFPEDGEYGPASVASGAWFKDASAYWWTVR